MLGNQFPIVVVGAVDPDGIYAPYSQGLAYELTVSAVGRVFCASHEGGATEFQGTSYGEPLSIQISTSNDIGCGDLAAPAVAGLAAYLMSLDQYSVQLLVPGSVARNVRDLIKSLAYARQALQPAVVWNGIDSRDVRCPVRRDTGSSGCPARNTTLPIGPPATFNSNSSPTTTTETSTTTVTSSSNLPPSSTATSTSTITMVTSSSNPLPSESSIATDFPTTSSDGGESSTITPTISLGGSTEIVMISDIF